MTDTLLRRIAELKTMSIRELKQKWRDLFESEPPAYNRRFIEHRLAYRIQELAYGGLKPETLKKLRIVKSRTGFGPGSKAQWSLPAAAGYGLEPLS